MKNLLLISALLFTAPSWAGPFMDFDLGINISQYPNEQSLDLLKNEVPMAIVRAGYETDAYHHDGGLIIRGHAYFEHISSLRTPDSGVNLIMIGVRLGI